MVHCPEAKGLSEGVFFYHKIMPQLQEIIRKNPSTKNYTIYTCTINVQDSLKFLSSDGYSSSSVDPEARLAGAGLIASLLYYCMSINLTPFNPCSEFTFHI